MLRAEKEQKKKEKNKKATDNYMAKERNVE